MVSGNLESRQIHPVGTLSLDQNSEDHTQILPMPQQSFFWTVHPVPVFYSPSKSIPTN